jgi:hypothetical protein
LVHQECCKASEESPKTKKSKKGKFTWIRGVQLLFHGTLFGIKIWVFVFGDLWISAIFQQLLIWTF